jgi:hypothetical protein
MTNPITPPPELVHQWADMLASGSGQAVFAMAAQWGADQELEACCEWFSADVVSEVIDVVSELRAARRPKPPTRKERALKSLDGLALPDDAFETIRFALEALDD